MRVQSPTSPCRACKAEIGWVVTAKGKRMPVDAVSLTAADREVLGRVGDSLPYRHGEHVSHFGTCPNAKQFRKES
jgi:hypothetical protein